MPEDLNKRVSEDFALLVTAHAKGDPAMYTLLRDRTLDADLAAARKPKTLPEDDLETSG